MKTSPIVRLVSCSKLPELAPDDQPLFHALRQLGAPTEIAVWDDPTIDWSDAPVTVVRSVFDYHLRRDEFIEWVDRVENQTMLQNPPEILRWNSHKSYLRKIEAGGFPIIPTEWVRQGEAASLQAICDRRGWDETIVKPAISASAYRTVKVVPEERQGGQEHLDGLLRDGDALVQPYLYDFETTGETSVIWLGDHQTHSVRRPSGIHTSLEVAHEGQALIPGSEELALAHEVYQAIKPTPLYARIDVINTKDYGLLVLELELVEPALYLRHSPAYAEAFARAITDLVETQRPSYR